MIHIRVKIKYPKGRKEVKSYPIWDIDSRGRPIIVFRKGENIRAMLVYNPETKQLEKPLPIH